MNINHKIKLAQNEYQEGFSLVELMISLITISLITAAFAPVITKKLSAQNIAITSSSTASSVSTKDICDLFDNKFWQNGSCKSCSDFVENCEKCSNGSTCTSCQEGYTLKNGKCQNEKIEKFKQAHEEFTQAIEALKTSEYFCKGDFGLKADCSTQLTVNSATRTYFCESMAKIMPIKIKNCKTNLEELDDEYGEIILSNQHVQCVATGKKIKLTVTDESILESKKFFDRACILKGTEVGAEIVSSNNYIYYAAGPDQYGSARVDVNTCNSTLTKKISLRYFSPPKQNPANYADQNGVDISYKIFCIDIDDIDYGEAPFGYGVRADGTILTGARADEWLAKSEE